MIFYFIVAFTFLNAPIYTSLVNTTNFWKNTLNQTQINFQVYAGYEQIDWYYPKNTTGMYYSLFSAIGHQLSTNQSEVGIPLIIWIEGGPGGSSQCSAFTQIGPIKILNSKAQLFHSSWNKFGHLLFIDQPLNVGFSYKAGGRQDPEQVSSSNQGADHLMNFMSNFYKTWPSLVKSPLYITGQSYAGHYIPPFASKLITNETWRNQTGVKLEGVSITGAWVTPMIQMNFYDSYLWSVGVVESKFRDVMTWYQNQGVISIYNGNYEKATQFDNFISNNDTTKQKYFGGMSILNFRQYQSRDLSFAQVLQNSKEELGARVDFQDGVQSIQKAFKQDSSKSYQSDFVLMLKNVRVLIYNGQQDFCVNTPGVLQYLNGLNWEGIVNWKRTKKQIWTIRGQNVGWTKIFGNFWFALINGAGHLTAIDQPQRVFNLLGHFILNEKQWRQ